MSMRLIFLVLLSIYVLIAGTVVGSLLSLRTDGQIPVKEHPDYTGVDPKIAPIVDEYKSLATKHRIIFTDSVSVGFTDIKYQSVVGVCNYGDNFREIDIDRHYWEVSTEETRRTLLFHELSHCYCLRNHDYGKDSPYPEATRSSRAKKDSPLYFYVSEGFFVDGCPLSIMYPYVLNDACMSEHKPHYEDEMFDRCQPY